MLVSLLIKEPLFHSSWKLLQKATTSQNIEHNLLWSAQPPQDIYNTTPIPQAQEKEGEMQEKEGYKIVLSSYDGEATPMQPQQHGCLTRSEQFQQQTYQCRWGKSYRALLQDEELQKNEQLLSKRKTNLSKHESFDWLSNAQCVQPYKRVQTGNTGKTQQVVCMY